MIKQNLTTGLTGKNPIKGDAITGRTEKELKEMNVTTGRRGRAGRYGGLKRIPLLCLMICFLLTGCGQDGKKDDVSTEGQTSTGSKTSSESKDPTEDKTSETTEKKEIATDQLVKILSHSVEKNYDGRDVLVIEYEWKNQGKDTTSFMIACNDTVYQNGIECPSIGVKIDGVDDKKKLEDLKPDAVLKFKVGYILQDKTNASVEICNLRGTKVYLDEVIDLGGGEGKKPDAANVKTSITLKESFLSKDTEGNTVLVIRYEFTNGEDSPKAFSTFVQDEVYQNGVQCSNLVTCAQVDANTPLVKIKPGVTFIVEEAYRLSDLSEVLVKVKKVFSEESMLSVKIKIE